VGATGGEKRCPALCSFLHPADRTMQCKSPAGTIVNMNSKRMTRMKIPMKDRTNKNVNNLTRSERSIRFTSMGVIIMAYLG
jgi:hypothetical protein